VWEDFKVVEGKNVGVGGHQGSLQTVTEVVHIL
jgi:hypothetical protein